MTFSLRHSLATRFKMSISSTPDIFYLLSLIHFFFLAFNVILHAKYFTYLSCL